MIALKRYLRPFGFGLLALTLVPLSATSASIVDDRFESIVADAKAEMMIDPQSALTKARSARAYADKAPAGQRAEMLATADWLAAEAISRTGESKSALPLVATALVEVERSAPRSRLHADILLSRGSIFADRGLVAPALRDLQSAHNLFRLLGETRSRAKALSQIAILYYDANDFTNAVKYALQAKDIYAADPGIALSVHNTIGNAYREQGRYADAEREYRDAFGFAHSLGSPLLKATILNNVARVALLRGDVDGAERALAESAHQPDVENVPGFLAQQLALQAQSMLQRGRLGKAETLIARAFAGKNLSRTTLADRESHRTAYEVYRRLNQPALALSHLAALKRLDDDATTLARSNSAALMGARFDFANQELRIAQLKADDLQKSVGFERARSRTQQLIFLGVVSAILAVAGLLLFGLFAIRRSRDEVRNANAELEEGNSALAKALAAKSEFLAVTSHEIRTPLNGILGMTQVMLADRDLQPRVRERVELVHGAGNTMRALVDDILDVAKIETGKLTLENVAFDLRQMLREACGLWEEQIAAKGIAFTVDLGSVPARIMGDPARVRQILFNLLANATKFTAEGEIRVTARCSVEGRFAIAVRDSGIGIPLEKQQIIFESFRQADAGTTRQFGGTGLGLAICRSLARALDGDVTVESRAGEGATFTLDLPLAVAEAEVGIAGASRAPVYLIVDRNPISRAMYRALLADAVGSIEAVDDIAAALRVAKEGPVRGALFDDATMRLAGSMSAVLETITRAIPASTVTVLTSGDDAAADTFRHADIAVLTKPLARAQLIAHVAAQLVAEDPTALVTQAA